MLNFINLSLIALLQLSYAGAKTNLRLHRETSELYTTSSGFRWTVKGSEKFQPLASSIIPKFESILGSFLSDNIIKSQKFVTSSVKATVVQVKKQTLYTDISELMVDSEIKIIYSSDESKPIDDFSSRLSQIFNTSETLKPLVEQLQKEQILKADVSSRDVTFPSIVIAPTIGDEPLTNNDSKLVTTLTVSVIILIGLLLTFSIFLVFFAKGRNGFFPKSGKDNFVGEKLRYNIKKTNTQDTASSSGSPTGILGAKEVYGQQDENDMNNGALVSMTPTRGVYDSDYDCNNTPGSLTSDMTNATQFSDTSRKPLGIVSMGKLDSLLVESRNPSSGHPGLYKMDTP